MGNVDPYLAVYIVVGVLIVLLTYVFLAVITDGVRSINQKMKEEELKKLKEEQKRRAG